MCSTLFSTSAQVALNSLHIWWVFRLSPDDIIINTFSIVYNRKFGVLVLVTFCSSYQSCNVATCNAMINYQSEYVY